MVLGLGLLKKGLVGSACAAKGAIQAVAGAAVGTVGAVLSAAKSVVKRDEKGERAEVESSSMAVVAAQQVPAASKVPARRVRRCLAAAAVLAPLASGSPMLYLGALAAATLTLVREKKEQATAPAITSESLQLQLELVVAGEGEATAADAPASEQAEGPVEAIPEAEVEAISEALGAPEPAAVASAAYQASDAGTLVLEGCGRRESRVSSCKRESLSEKMPVVSEPVVQEPFSTSAREPSGSASSMDEPMAVAAMVSEEVLCDNHLSVVRHVVAEECVKGQCGEESCEAEEGQEECQSEGEAELEVESSCELDQEGEGAGEGAEDSENEVGDEGEMEEAKGSAEGTGIQVPTTRQVPILISEGAYGKVYKAGSDKALKWMENVDPKKVEREYGMMVFFAGLCSNVLGAEKLDLGDSFGGYLMPLCAGTSTKLLKAYRQAYGKPGLPEKWVVQILKQMAKALRACHANGVCHFDIKPDNILLAQFPCSEEEGVARGAVKLCDFGEAMELDHLGEVARPIGTEYYMAPEMLALGEEPKGAAPPIGCACDMYSLGITALVLLDGGEETGCPWVGEATQQLVKSLLHVDPTQRITADEFLQSKWLLEHPLLQ